MKLKTKQRVFSMLLVLTMILSLLPPDTLTIFAVETEDTVSSDYGSHIGNTAEFNMYFPVPVTDDPKNINNPFGTDCQQLTEDEAPKGLLMVIVDYYYNSESGDLWYMVQAAPGQELPEKLKSNPWVFQDNMVSSTGGNSLNIHKSGTNVILDSNGNVIDLAEGVDVPKFGKVSMTAQSTLQGSVSYQWQICYDRAKDLWVDIYGENEAAIKLSYGMLFNLMDEQNTAYVRCKSVSGSKEAFCMEFPVTVVTNVQQSFVTSAGKDVTVSVQGDIPEDVTLDIFETESDAEAMEGVEVLLTLDISIVNKDGSQWQPESGETVTVTLPAATLGISKGDYFVVYHEHDGKIEALGPYQCQGDTISFEAGGFSKFIFALTEAQSLTTEDFLGDIGKHATLHDIYDYLWLVDDPTAIKAFTGNWYQYVTVGNGDYVMDLVFEIVDVYVSSVPAYGVFYKVKVIEGENPTDVFETYPWIFQKYVDDDDEWNTLILFDAEQEEPKEPSCDITVDGNKVSEVAVSTATKVTVSAVPANVTGTTTAYQWQIFMPAANMWVNISGQTNADCTVNYGMVANRLDADGKAQIRCVMTVDGVEIPSESIAVNILVTYARALYAASANAKAVTPMAEGDAAGKYTVNVYYYIGDTDVMQDEVHPMQFGVTEEARDVSFDIAAKAGYTPYYFGTSTLTGKANGTLISADKYTIENFRPQSDMNLIVRYYPNEDTPYKVEHYIQNVYDDEYTLHSTTDHKGTTDALVPDFNDGNLILADLEAKGFYAIPYKRAAIASDGGTVIQIYYDRYMYLMLFDLGEGGMGVEPVYGRHGVEYTVGTPKRLGYTFDGWVDENGNTINVTTTGEYTFTIPARDVTYTAKWKEDNANYTIVFWRADLDDGDAATPTTYSYWGSATIGSVSGTALTPATVGNQNPAEEINDESFDNDEAPYFAYDADATAQNNPAAVTVAGDGSTIINVYYNRKVFEIRYLYARQNGNMYGIATWTGDGKLASWYTVDANTLPILKNSSGFEAQTEEFTVSDWLGSSTTYTYYYITLRAEYGANIESQWPADVLNSRGNYSFGSWAAENGTGYRETYGDEHANIVGAYPYMSADMIKEGNEDIAYIDEKTGETYYIAQRMSAWWGTSNSIDAHSYHIYYEVLDGTGDREYNGKQYKLVRTLGFVAAHNDDTRVDPFYYNGYVCVNDTRGQNSDPQKDSKNYKKGTQYYNCPENSCDYCNCFYYDREVNTLSFYNHNEATNAAGKTFASAELKFEQSLSDGLPNGEAAPYEPPYPAGLDAGGYAFKGWYTSPGCYDGTEVDWSSPMPAGDLTVYAKWEPVEHTVEFYFDETLGERLDATKFPTQTILHNNYGKDPGLPGHPMDFEAVTWFYKDANGVEKSFDFAMPVKQDMKLYPKWRSTVFINYEIRYKVFDQSTNSYTDIEIAAPTYGQELYGETITVTPKGTEEFYDAYRTEKNGYFPMTGSHSIIMGESQCSGDPKHEHCVWDEETKTHIFTYYYVNGPTVPYTVKYHLVDADGDFIRKLSDDKYVSDNYMAKVVENAKIMIGYKPDAAQKTLYVVHGETNEIIFEYTEDENASWYSVTHYIKKYGSTAYEVYEEHRYVANIGDVVSVYNPITIPGCKYTETKVSNDDYIVKSGDETEPGFWIALYYEEEPVPIQYKVMGDFGGMVTTEQETIGVAYGTAVGSEAVPLSGAYKFVGWYDANGNLITTDGKFVPKKADGLHVAATYYAKFEYNLTSLKIVKSGWDPIDGNQSFLFRISGNDLELDVVIHGNDSVVIDGLTVGETYKVTEITDWSWRYGDTPDWSFVTDGDTDISDTDSAEAQIVLGVTGNEITFTNTRDHEKWLDGDTWADNRFTS